MSAAVTPIPHRSRSAASSISSPQQRKRVKVKSPSSSDEDGDHDEPNDDDQDDNEQVEQAAVVARTSSASPTNAITTPSPIFWAPRFPNLVQYYRHHQPDWSGAKLYAPEFQFPADYNSHFVRNPTSFTLSVLLAETARLEPRLPPNHLLAIKGYGLTMLRQMLDDETRHNANDLVAALTTLIAYELVFEADLPAARVHLMGLARVISSRGGLQSLNAIPAIRNAAVFIDTLHAHIAGKPRLIGPVDQSTLRITRAVGIDNPFRLAIQPTTSRLPLHRLHNHLLISIGAPIQLVLNVLLQLFEFSHATLVAPYGVAPTNAYMRAESLQSRLHELGAHHARFGLSAPIFSEYDKARNHAIVESLRLFGLLLVSKLLEALHPSTATSAAVDHAAQTFTLFTTEHQHVLGADIHFWALVSGAMFFAPGLQHALFAERAAELIAVQRRQIGSWDSMRQFLAGWIYIPQLQDAAAATFCTAVFLPRFGI